MDEIAMFTALRPEGGPVDICGARDRLTATIAGPQPRPLPRKTRFAMVGGLVATATAAAIVVPSMLPDGAGSATAWAVDRNQDGTVTVTLGQEFSDPAGLQQTLRRDGIVGLRADDDHDLEARRQEPLHLPCLLLRPRERHD